MAELAAVEDVSVLLQNGADKISVNTAAFKNPELIRELCKDFGSQCVVLAIDTKKEEDGEWYVYLNGGRTKTETKCFDWAKEAVDIGAGEILLTSMNHDGTKKGFALDITCNFPQRFQSPLLHVVAVARWNILLMYLKMEKQMRHWQQAFFILKKLVFLN